MGTNGNKAPEQYDVELICKLIGEIMRQRPSEVPPDANLLRQLYSAEEFERWTGSSKALLFLSDTQNILHDRMKIILARAVYLGMQYEKQKSVK